jgi:hypothetical protein
MSDELYYKVPGSKLTAIADAIRLQRKSEKKYTIDDMPRIIKAMLCLPSGEANSEGGIIVGRPSTAIGINPTVYRGTANSPGGSITGRASTASGFLVEEGG